LCVDGCGGGEVDGLDLVTVVVKESSQKGIRLAAEAYKRERVHEKALSGKKSTAVNNF
jgi:hypothetical protein